MTAETGTPQDTFLAAFRGGFTAALRWHHLDALWERLRERADAGWYLYALGETPPTTPARTTPLSAAKMMCFGRSSR